MIDNKKILFIGHSYHKKTNSSKFIEELLRQKYEVEFVYNESWIRPEKDFNPSFFDLDEYSAIIIWQVADLLPSDFIEDLSQKNTIFFPMENYYDDWDTWKKFKKFKIISFSKYNYSKLKKWGFDVQYFQYFPKPEVFPLEQRRKRRYIVFFWQRINALTWEEVKKLLNYREIEKVILHKSVDPGHQFVMPSMEDIKKFNIEFTEWFNDRSELKDTIAQADIYIAPRITEGIGMSFLEAMAMGKAVIAANMPTMNEYIEHRKNGYLFNIDHIYQIDFSDINSVRLNCIRSIERGFQQWNNQKGEIYNIIERRYSPNKFLLLKTIINHNSKKLIIKAKSILKEITPFFIIMLRRKYLLTNVHRKRYPHKGSLL
jgi:glycosyltransferase involved in cell wall biosynthesis